MNNTFFTGNDVWDITFTSKLRTFIKENKYGFYVDVYIPESHVLNLLKHGMQVKYINEGVDSGYVIRCKVRSDSNITLNGIKMRWLSKDTANQDRVTQHNTSIKVLELYPFAESTKRSGDTQCSIIRAAFKTEAQKLPKGFLPKGL